jgi:glycosyltransferase involved in cell wall biosynthesis
MMQILYVTNEVPDPSGGGSQRRAAMHLRALERLGDVTMIVPPLDGSALQFAGVRATHEREPTLAEDRFWRHEGSQSPIKRKIHALRKLNYVDARARPSDIARFPALLDTHYDLMFAFRLRSVVWWESIFGREPQAGTRRVVDLDDIESVVFEKRIKDVTLPFWKWKFTRELAWLRATEIRVAQQWDAFCQCSEVDVARMETMTGRTAWQIPNAYDFEPVIPEAAMGPAKILFVGTLSYFPNVEGIDWFVTRAWPVIRNALQDQVELEVVGLRPPAEVLAMDALPGISVTANAPSVLPYYHAAQIVIAPLLAGSGTRIKLIEAAALGRAIVTTSLGCEGLDFVDGVHAEIADNPIDFAQRVVALARDPVRRARLAEAARIHAMQAFSADAVTATLERSLRALGASRTS